MYVAHGKDESLLRKNISILDLHEITIRTHTGVNIHLIGESLALSPRWANCANGN